MIRLQVVNLSKRKSETGSSTYGDYSALIDNVAAILTEKMLLEKVGTAGHDTFRTETIEFLER